MTKAVRERIVEIEARLKVLEDERKPQPKEPGPLASSETEERWKKNNRRF